MTDRTRILSFSLLFWSACSAAAAPLALSCLGCHQPSVDSAQMPALHKLTSQQIALALRQSRDTPRFGSIMARFTAKMSDAQIDRLAAELGRKPK